MKTNSSLKKNISNYEDIIHRKLKGLNLNKIAKDSGFTKRKALKITPKNFLIGFFLMAFSSTGGGSKSLELWASKIGMLIHDTLSKQALGKKITEPQVRFLKEVLEVIVRRSLLAQKSVEVIRSSGFKNIFIQDSTHINLNGRLSKYYSGNENMYKKTKKSVLKIQTIYNLAKKTFRSFELTGYRENDLSRSADILKFVHKGDLVLRDLGYFISSVFQSLNSMGAYYVSRLKVPINIYSAKTGEIINLQRLLKGRASVDINVVLGEDSQLMSRLVALRLEDKVANKRRRKLLKARQEKGKPRPSKQLLQLLGWAIFITNADKDKLSINQVMELYTLRWRIEVIFKCWKSYFKINDLKMYENKFRMESYVYSMLIFIVLFQTEFFRYIEDISEEEISLMKYSKFIASNILLLLFIEALGDSYSQCFIKQIIYYCRYERRQDRENFYAKLSLL